MSLKHVGIGAFQGRMSRPNRWLRRYSLFFDRFDIIDLDECMYHQRTSGYGKAETIEECDWLIDHGYLAAAEAEALLGKADLPELHVLDAEIDALGKEYDEITRQLRHRLDPQERDKGTPSGDDVRLYERQFRLSCDIAAVYAERTARNVRRSGREIATSLEMPPRQIPLGVDAPLDAAGMFRFVISSIPVPAQRVPWEEIFAFKADPDSLERLRTLRAWIAETARGSISLAEASDRVHDALTRYREHVRGAAIAHDAATWEALVKSGIASPYRALDEWTANGAPRPFVLAHLLGHGTEAGRAAPGRELSYLVKVEDAGL